MCTKKVTKHKKKLEVGRGMFSPTLDVRQLMLCLFAINLLNAAADTNTKKQQIFFLKRHLALQ